MIVYRIENAESKLGPYRHWDNCPGVIASCYTWTRHPDPARLDVAFEKSDVFGFLTKQQLKNWFPKRVRKGLTEDNKFVVRAFRINKKYVNSDIPRQICFNRKKVTSVRELDPLTLEFA